MKRMKKIAALLAACLLAAAMPGLAESVSARANRDANVRRGPSKRNDIVFTLEKGEEAIVDETVTEGGEIQGEITLDGAALEPEPGETYTGDIQVIGSYGQEPEESVQEEAEASEVQETIAAVQPAAPETPEPEQQTEPQPEPAESHTNTVIAVVLAVLAICIIAGAVVAKKKKK